MADNVDLIEELQRYALSKRGAEQYWKSNSTPHVRLRYARWDGFFDVDEGERGETILSFPVTALSLAQYRTAFPTITQSRAVERDGHVYMLVPVDIPRERLMTFIDEAYDIVWNKLDARGRLLIELAELPYDELNLLERLIAFHGLRPQRDEILAISRPAVLLRTKGTMESLIPLGATKIGGRPDLPANVHWPAYGDGTPLAFLAQINLAEIAKLGSPIAGLPKDGLLTVFSVWGWVAHDDQSPQTPGDRTEWRQEEAGWTVALHVRPHEKLVRRETPDGVNSFKAAAVEPTPMLSLPGHRIEPPLAALGWSEDVLDRYDSMDADFCRLQMVHWFNASDVMAGHQLGGYALFQQQFPEEVLEKRLAMLLQIASDDNTEMCWDDSGELTFYADARGLAEGRFERLWATSQGG